MSNNHPFANHKFLQMLEDTNCVNEQTGWISQHFKTDRSMLMGYLKLHSFGEYIFDWAWAEFYKSNSLNYYPKLIHAIPFTPVNAPKFLGDSNDFKTLAKKSFDFYQNQNISGEHYLFINDEEQKLLEELDFSTKLTHQYHFYNDFDSFDDFLSKLKKNRRKNIKKERKAIFETDLLIKKHTQEKITLDLLEDFYLFYISTIIKKGSHPYLTREFFLSLDPKETLIIAAYKDEKVIAMALFFYSHDTLYGRNWGISPEYEKQYPFLHFELCYYQGIEFCIENKIKIFEAGAQGEHKLIRGFRPVVIKSAHHIKIAQCYEIIKQDIKAQNEQVKRDIKVLSEYLPFKNQ